MIHLVHLEATAEDFKQYADFNAYHIQSDPNAFDMTRNPWGHSLHSTMISEIDSEDWHKCDTEGHLLRDCSYGGPDSGNMDHECTRCGQYWHVPLY